jgi:hypothetical protein
LVPHATVFNAALARGFGEGRARSFRLKRKAKDERRETEDVS